MALMVQRNLSQIGVDMQLESVSLDEFTQRLHAGDFDTALSAYVVGTASSRPYFLWYSTSKEKLGGYGDALVDQALDRLRYAPNEEATRAAFHDLQAGMLNNPPAVFLAFGETTRAVSRRFQPVVPPGGDIFRTISEWRLADETQSPNTN